jgi:hypothetical protein
MAIGNSGELYIGGASGTNDSLVVVKSLNAYKRDSVVSWNNPVRVYVDGNPGGWNGVNPGGLMGQVSIGVDHSDGPGRGNVYILASLTRTSNADPGDVMFARSTDGGLTWSSPTRINDDPSDKNTQWFGTMSVAPNGRLDAIWLDTRDAPAGSDSSDLYYSFSADQGKTWSANEKMSGLFDPHVGYPNQNKLGDYFDMEFVPGGDLISENTLINHTKVVNGKIISPSGRSYAMLVLPKKTPLSSETIKAISSLVFKGAVVYGYKPAVFEGSKSKKENSEEVTKLLSLLWNTTDTIKVKENTYGKGKVIWGRTLPEALASLKITPEVVVLKSDNANAVFWNHRVVGETDIFYFTNIQAQTNHLQLQLRVGNKRPEMWNPETGEIFDAPLWQPTKDGIRVNLNLKGNQSLFIVFKENLKKENFIRELKIR